METCNECGKKFSTSIWKKLFTDASNCPECKRDRKEKIQKYVDKLIEFGKDKYLDKNEEKELLELQNSLELNDDDLQLAKRRLENLRQLTKQANIKMYEDKLRQAGADSYLDSEEDAELSQLIDFFGLTSQDISHTMADLVGLKRLSAIQDGKLPILDADILLRKKEVCHYEIPTSLIEEKSRTKFVGGSQGVSIRIAKGVSYRVGGFKGERIVETFNETTDSGSLYITNKRVIFVGGKKNVTYPINKIINISKYSDAIHFQKENEKKPKYFLINDQFAIDEIGLIINHLVSED